MAFDEFSFFEYMVETYEIQMTEKDNLLDRASKEERAIPTRGRSRNLRDRYMSNHPKSDSHIQIERTENHNYLPNVIGRWFP